MGYDATWNSTDQVPARAVDERLDRSLRHGRHDRRRRHVPLQRLDRMAAHTRQRHDADRGLRRRLRPRICSRTSRSSSTIRLTAISSSRPIGASSSGVKVSHRWLGRWSGRTIADDGRCPAAPRRHLDGRPLSHRGPGSVSTPCARTRSLRRARGGYAAERRRMGAVASHARRGCAWMAIGSRVEAGEAVNGGTARAALASPKGGVVLGPWRGTELYVNGGLGFHSNDARGATITVDPTTGEPRRSCHAARPGEGRRGRDPQRRHSATADERRALDAGARLGAGVRRRRGHDRSRVVQAGATGSSWSNYYSPRPWLTFDGDLSISRGRFTDDDPAGNRIPGSVETVVSAGATIDSVRNLFGSIRLRYFGPRPLIEDESVSSKATSLVNLQAGYRFSRALRLAVDVFNLFDAQAQRHRLLLCLASSRRAARRRRRPPLPSDAAADRARRIHRRFLGRAQRTRC